MSGSPAGTVTVAQPAGTAFGDLQFGAFAFEGVAAGSGPWVTSANQGWVRVLSQAPVGGSGVGIEVWSEIQTVGNTWTFNLTASMNFAFRGISFANAFPNESFSSFTHTTLQDTFTVATQGVVGNNPASPALQTWVDDMALVFGGDELQAPGFNSPAPWTGPGFDNARNGTQGLAEICCRSQLAPTQALQQLNFTVNAVSSTTRGSTAIVVVRPPDRRFPIADAGSIPVL